MNSDMQFKLITPAKTVFDEVVTSVTVPTASGEITVLPEHTTLASIISPGELIVRSANNTERAVAVSGGIVEVQNNTLIVLADTALDPDEIDLEAAEAKSRELSQDIENKADLDITNYNTLERSLAYENAKLRVAKKWRKL